MAGSNDDELIMFLIKTLKSKYVADTMKKGRFCFNHPAVFNKWENKSAAQYDRWDAHSAHNATHLMYFPIIGEKDGFPVYGKGNKFADKAIVRIQTKEVQQMPICCFRMVEEHEVHHYPGGIEFSLGDDADRIASEFEHDAYVMIEANPFLHRLQGKHVCFAGPIVYKDTTNDYEFDVPEQYKDIAEQLFRKDAQYAWQKEYRIALMPSDNTPVFIELGSIEDIAISGMLSDLRK